MKTRILGQELQVSAMGLGCMRMSFGDQPIGDRADMIQFLHQAVVDLLRRIGDEKQATPAQVALAWLLRQKPWIVPIPGSRKLSRLDENNGAVDLALTDQDLGDLQEAMSRITVVGHRY